MPNDGKQGYVRRVIILVRHFLLALAGATAIACDDGGPSLRPWSDPRLCAAAMLVSPVHFRGARRARLAD